MADRNWILVCFTLISTSSISQMCHCYCKQFKGLNIIENVVMVPSNTDILLPNGYTCTVDSGRKVVANEEICLNMTEQGKATIRLPCITPDGNTMSYSYHVRKTFLNPTTFTWWMPSNGATTAESTVVHYDTDETRIVADFEYGRNISVLMERALTPYSDIAIWKVDIEIGNQYIASWNDYENGYLRCHVSPAYQDFVSLLASGDMFQMTLKAGCKMNGRFHLTETLLSVNVDEAKSVSKSFTFLLRPIGHTDIEIIQQPDHKNKLAVLRCHIHDFGKNLPYHFKWHKKTQHDKKEVSTHKTLVIKEFSYVNNGKYYCTASYKCVTESSGMVELNLTGIDHLLFSSITSKLPVDSNEHYEIIHTAEARVQRTLNMDSYHRNEGSNVVFTMQGRAYSSLIAGSAAAVIAVIVSAAVILLCIKKQWCNFNPTISNYIPVKSALALSGNNTTQMETINSITTFTRDNSTEALKGRRNIKIAEIEHV